MSTTSFSVRLMLIIGVITFLFFTTGCRIPRNSKTYLG